MDTKLGKTCLAHVFKCSPTCGSILRNTHRGETSPGLWSPEAGLDYLPVSSRQHGLCVSILRIGDDIHRLSGRKNYLFSETKWIYNPTLNVNYCWKKRNLTHRSSVIPLLLLPETLQQCQRAQDFLHMRHNFRPLYFCKHHILCQECPFLPLSAWRTFSYF